MSEMVIFDLQKHPLALCTGGKFSLPPLELLCLQPLKLATGLRLRFGKEPDSCLQYPANQESRSDTKRTV